MVVKLFPLWVVCAAAAGMLFPGLFSPLKAQIDLLLMIVMLGMGLTLRPQNFFDLRDYRWAVLAGVLLQFSVMPLMALLIATGFRLDGDLTAGMVLVGSVAGGTASNVITLLARGNVALSVSMTAFSTCASVLMTPLLMVWLAGSRVDVPALDMVASLFTIILIPVALGVTLNVWAEKWVNRLKPALPGVSVAVIALIIAVVVALNAGRIAGVAVWIFLATLVHNLSGLALGYMAAHLLGFDRTVCRTIAIEVGMQNSGLATALALKFFGAAAALPGAIFSIWLNITGSIFASACVRRDQRETGSEEHVHAD